MLPRGSLFGLLLMAQLGLCSCRAATPKGADQQAATSAQQYGAPPPGQAASTQATGATVYEWQPATRSPEFTEPPRGLRDLAKRCERFELGLMRAAQQVAQRQAAGHGAIGSEELKFALRASGVPHAWEQTWSLAGPRLDPEDAAARLDPWLAQAKGDGELRCGLAQAEGPSGQVLAVIAVDAVGELSSVPTRARLGQWLDVQAQLLIDSEAAKVVLLGPNGAPRPVPTPSLRNNRLRLKVSLDKPGPWVIQVLSVHASGPRPALEAVVHVDTEPNAQFTPSRAPGEEAGRGAKDAASALIDMANLARSQTGAPALRRDATLDRLAHEHALRMRKNRQLAHDFGSGGPAQRIANAGLQVSAAGENLAHAKDATSGHRVLWASPAHRNSMLERRFTSIGVGVAEDEDRSIWICELYAGFSPAGKMPLAR